MEPVSNQSIRSGFTILEVLVSISIAMILVGIGVGFSFQTLSIEKKISRISGKIEVAVRNAQMSAAIDRKDIYLTLYENSVRGSRGAIDLGTARLSIRHPGRFEKWKRPPRKGYTWKFDSNGLSDPVAIKLGFDEGEMTMHFDPLTGEVKDRSMTIAK
ncbi:MAG: prepilin-type N-terminal cleavage/methylation domain-containing protein [Verrucomicrobiales bacterium]|nr:prepilin-type N-terminal cleavage/methylation domain-containing protein [Verrucomicrobiales bacterium]